MTQEETIESMRYELGQDAAQRGDPLHDGASEEFYHGYADKKPTAWRGSSNVTPRLFGKGAEQSKEWVCICGYHNPRYVQRKCWECGLNRKLAEHAKHMPDLDQ